MLKIFIIEVVRSLSLLSYSSRSRSLWSCKSRGCVHSSSRCSNHRALAHHKPKRPFFLFVPSASFPSSTNLSFFSFPGLCFLRFSFFGGVGVSFGCGPASAATLTSCFGGCSENYWRDASDPRSSTMTKIHQKKPRFQVYDEHSMATTGPPSFSFSFFRRKKTSLPLFPFR